MTQDHAYQLRAGVPTATPLHAPVGGGGTQFDRHSLGMGTLCSHSQHSLRTPTADGETLEGNQTFKLVY